MSCCKQAEGFLKVVYSCWNIFICEGTWSILAKLLSLGHGFGTDLLTGRLLDVSRYRSSRLRDGLRGWPHRHSTSIRILKMIWNLWTKTFITCCARNTPTWLTGWLGGAAGVCPYSRFSESLRSCSSGLGAGSEGCSPEFRQLCKWAALHLAYLE